jgi:hypothetical protein
MAAPVIDATSLARKRRIDEFEVGILEVELETKKLVNVSMNREHLIRIIDRYRDLCQDTMMDDGARLMLKNSLLNMVVT